MTTPYHSPQSRRAALWLALGLMIGACSPLKTFDALVPKDGEARRVATGLAYGRDARQVLDIYAPRLGAAGSKPVIVFFYGGSWNSGTRSGYAFVGRALAAQGFVVVIPDYRLVPNVRYPAFVEDGAVAVRWAEANVGSFGGDPRRIVLMGHSAGGYIAAMLAVDDRWLGPDRSAVRGLVGLAAPYDFAPFDVDVSRAAFGAWPRPEETQPVHWAGAGDPPALLLVGGEDRTVPPRNSETLANRLRTGSVPVTLRTYPKLGHVGMILSVARPFRGRAPVIADVAAFAHAVTR
ncbi:MULTISPECIES: alpha/beta hydrolase [unclassified Sphingomonas]|uniref:alpha/beta hydrolase n=1 Tax=unclassified Sphingomonas TaxID=196159 RepID=UPI00285B161D|nr:MULTISPECIES: alpha/beta hydrolase [unclassified Sphingomonas]MDR6115752.1 acetyl esterase/lipase [Sphingomonas sp. SORGH_AS_0789]MDR6150577.1 acetyl esterase/lipase [Sphingomonas sp. SORGH_AS_0742]